MGRKPLFDYKGRFTDICKSVSSGNTLSETARKMGFLPGAFYNWLVEQPKEINDNYARARQLQAEVWQDVIIDAAWDNSNDTIEIEKNGVQVIKENKEWINRSRLKVDALKWIMARNHAARFGDKTETTIKGDADAPLEITWTAKPKELKQVN